MLSQLSSESIASMLEAVADVQLQLNDQGYCEDVSITNPELTDLMGLPWRGADWLDFCAERHRGRAKDAFRKALEEPGRPVRVEIEQIWSGADTPYPMNYRLVATSDGKQVIAIGEDLRASSELRQQLVNAQQIMERDYWALRRMENRYRKLLEMSTDALILLDFQTTRVLEANGVALALLGNDDGSLIGKTLPSSAKGLLKLVERAKGSIDTVRGSVALNGNADPVNALVSALRQDSEHRLLLRLSPDAGHNLSGDSPMDGTIEAAPDGIVQTDAGGLLVGCNRTFLDWIQVETEEQAIGRPIDTWLGRSTVDMSVLLENLRSERPVKLFASVLRGSFGQQADVEISAVSLARSKEPRYVLFVRETSRRVSADHPLTAQLPRSIEKITERVGRVPLKELVRESTDVIEALCIEAALTLTSGNRASAAEMLGVSRQSLYMKLRRFDMGTSADD